MSLKHRFAIFFTAFVALILLVSSVTIYLFYKNNREEDYYVRLHSRCTTLVSEYKSLNEDTLALAATKGKRRSLYYQSLVIIKPPFNVVYKELDSTNLTITKELLATTKRKGEQRFKQGEDECLGIYYPDYDLYIFGGAIDRTGLRKLSNLFYILIGVFGGGLLITSISSFAFVQQAFRPLFKLSHQIQQTTTSNMTTKVDEGNGKDEIVQIARHFNAMLERLNNGFEMQKNFVNHASHELRTPLTTMLSQTEAALNRDLSKEEYKTTLLSLHEEQTNLIELTNSLLILSQFEKINTNTNWPSQRVDELVFESIASCKRLFPEIKIEFSFQNIPEDESELMISGNDALLKSAFLNLIKNAYLYSINKIVQIIINPNPDSLEISFMNKGYTLSEQEAATIFVPFFRGSNSNQIKGYGLRLSIIKRIVELHNGNINYTALNNTTNKFTIEFKI